jgi:hypothetical protein
MYPYITPHDAGHGDEGDDAEDTEGMGDLFDSPSDDQTTFDMDPDRPFSLDGLGRTKRLSAPRLVEDQDTGRLIDVETLAEPDEDDLPDPPPGQKWKYVGPNESGDGYDYETVPSSGHSLGRSDAAKQELTVHTLPDVDGGFMDMVKRNKAVVGASAVAAVGALWWLFLRKRA